MKTNFTRKQSLSIIATVAIGVLLGALILMIDKAKPAGDAHGGAHGHSEKHAAAKGHDEHGDAEHGHDESHEEEQAKGPHGGKLFQEGDFGLEVLLSEDGGDPRFHVYLFNKGKPMPANAAKVSIALTRPDGEKQEITFTAEKDALKSNTAIAEPHVFEATVAARTKDEPHLFTFAEEEGKIALDDAQVKAAGITIDTAGAAKINSALTLPGEIHFNEDKTAHVVPRLAGVVESVRVNLGEKVKKAQVLAVIASSDLSEQRSELLSAQKRLALAKTTFEREKKLWQEKISAEQDYLQAQQAMHEAEIAVRNLQQKLSAMGANTAGAGALNRYEIRAPFAGTVMEKHISLGEAVKEDANIFTLSDLSTVWAEVAVPAKDLNAIRVGVKAIVRATAFDAKATGTIAYVGSLLGEQTRTAKARVALANPEMAWRPGLFVNVEIVSDEREAPVAVKIDAVQTVNDKPTVFVRVPGGFLAQQVTLGRSDGKVVEIVKGLKVGTPYAVAGSFIVKSEQGKASAEHTH
jgi:cobalt-zinc-cadmium efflux system membrane fusion protein